MSKQDRAYPRTAEDINRRFLQRIKDLEDQMEQFSKVDAVVEQGISGIWTYRKWKSGVAECWFNTNVIFDAKQKIDLGFKQNDGQDMQLTYVDIALPFQFVDSPSSTCTCNWSYSEWVQSNAGANIVRVRLMGTTKSVESAVTNGTKCSVQIKGRWK